MPYLTLPDVTLHFEVDGNGPPVVLIAGMASDGASWGPLVGRLAECHTVIRPDNRSTGRSTPWDAPVSVPIWAGDIVALLDHLEIAQAHLVGHSLGGMIGMQVARDAPARVRSLTLLSAAPLRLARNDALFAMMLALRGQGMARDLWLRAFYPWLFHPRFFDDPDVVETAINLSLAYPHAQSAAAMAHQAAALRGFDPATLRRGPDLPVLALLAAHDLLIPQHAATAALADFPRLTLDMVPEAGHSVHWDAPEAVLARLTPFLACHAGAAR